MTEADITRSALFFNFQPKALVTSEKEALFYNINQKHRGLAIILNHENFNDPKLKKRVGTEADAENLQIVLNQLGFVVETYSDLEYVEISKLLKTTAAKDFSDFGCLCIFVMTHGENGILYAKDLEYYTQEIWERFTANRCPSLAGKPKMFFFQACRGAKRDDGVRLHKIQTDSSPNESYIIPSKADVLLVYSTVEDYVSYREVTKGSWFIQAFCNILSTRHKEFDLLTLLTLVTQEVAFHNDKIKQLPVIVSMLTRLVYFDAM